MGPGIPAEVKGRSVFGGLGLGFRVRGEGQVGPMGWKGGLPTPEAFYSPARSFNRMLTAYPSCLTPLRDRPAPRCWSHLSYLTTCPLAPADLRSGAGHT